MRCRIPLIAALILVVGGACDQRPTEPQTGQLTAQATVGSSSAILTTSTTGVPVKVLGRGGAYSVAGPNYIVGFCNPPGGVSFYACMWKRESELALASSGFAQGVNHHGQIVGWVDTGAVNSYHNDIPTSEAVLWYRGDTEILESLGGPSAASAINDRGDVVGGSWVPDELGTRAVIWEKGKIRQLASSLSGAADINNRGQVVGFVYPRAVLWEKGEAQELELPSGGTVAFAYAINDIGDIVGACSTPETHACLWRDGEVLDLGTLVPGVSSWALDINNRDQVVGYSEITPHGFTHAFLWEDGTMTDLGTLDGEYESAALAITEDGRIVGDTDYFFGGFAVVWYP